MTRTPLNCGSGGRCRSAPSSRGTQRHRFWKPSAAIPTMLRIAGTLGYSALEAIDHGDQDVAQAARLEIVHDLQPELGALGLLDPQAEHVLVALRVQRQCDVDRLVADQPLVADLDPQRIEENDRRESVQRTGL